MGEVGHGQPLPGSSAPAPEPALVSSPERRSFLRWAVHGLGALFALVLGVPGFLYLIDPRNRPTPARDFKTVARLSELKENEPQQFVIHDVRTDAWTLHPNDVVGRVWVVKRSKDEVDVFTTVCPHLGCSVNYDANSQRFICPCHGGTFDVYGHRITLTDRGKKNPAPRDLDRLQFQIPAGTDLLQVIYQNFRQGEPTKEPKA
jgi:Rieske Fe-S protein